jgi:hypothetical protein
LYYLLVPEMLTALGGHDWVLHILSASVHGLNAALLWILLRRIGMDWRVASFGALLFVAYPAPWEVVLWPSAIPTGFATALFQCACLLYIGYVRGSARWPALIAIALATFAIPCLNEQPATGVAALPLLAFAARQNEAPGRRRWLCGWVAALAPVGLYLALFLTTAPAGARGSATGLISSSEFGSKFAVSVHSIKDFMLMPNFRGGAAKLGFRTLIDNPTLSAALLAALAVSAVPWLRRWMLHSQAQPTPSGHAPWMAAFGAAIFTLGWLPVVLFKRQGVEPRLCYFPGLGCVLAAAATALAFNGLLDRSKALRALSAAALLATIGVGAVILIGVQAAMQKRWRRDLAQAAQLRGLFPSPAPGTVFIPVRIDETNTTTGAARFDSYFCGPMERPWSGGQWIRRGYRRWDVDVGFWGPFADWRPALQPAADGLSYDDRFLPPMDELKGSFSRDDRGAKILPWPVVIPILIDDQGTVRPVIQMAVTRPDGPAQTYSIPQVAAAGEPRVTGAVALSFESTASQSNFVVNWQP